MAWPAGDVFPADWQTTDWTLKSDVAYEGTYSIGYDASDVDYHTVRTEVLTAGVGGDTLYYQLRITGAGYCVIYLDTPEGVEVSWLGDTSMSPYVPSDGNWHEVSHAIPEGSYRVRIMFKDASMSGGVRLDAFSGIGSTVVDGDGTAYGHAYSVEIATYSLAASAVSSAAAESPAGAISDHVGIAVETAAAAPIMNGAPVYVVAFSGTMAGSMPMTARLMHVASAMSHMVGADTFSLQMVLNATFYAVIGGAPLVSLDDDWNVVWVVNAETGGSTRYENYAFNSFAFIDGAYYGCRADGIYRLDGDTDAGDPIQAMVSFGKQDFGTSAMKSVTNAYVGLSSAGRMFLKVRVGDHDYTYAARGSSEHLQAQRFDIGRGLRGTYIEFELYNADGDDFELASVEFVAIPLSRRI